MPNINLKQALQVEKWCRSENTGELVLDTNLLALIDDRLSTCQLGYQFTQAQQQNILQLNLSCQINLQCQRCSKTYCQSLKSSSTLALSLHDDLATENLIESLGFEFFVYNEQTNLLDIVREEIDLNTPYFPHCLDGCEFIGIQTMPTELELKQRPFAKLKDLVQQKSTSKNN